MTKLKLNYSKLNNLATRLGSHAQELSNIKDALDTYVNILLDQSSIAAEQFLVDIDEVKRAAQSQKEIENDYGTLVKRYVNDMQQVMPAVCDDDVIEVDISSVDDAIKAMEAAVEAFKGAIDAVPEGSAVPSFHVEANADLKAIEATNLEERLKQSRNYQKVLALKSMLSGYASSINDEIKSIKSVKKEVLLKAVETDENYVELFKEVVEDSKLSPTGKFMHFSKSKNFNDFLRNKGYRFEKNQGWIRDPDGNWRRKDESDSTAEKKKRDFFMMSPLVNLVQMQIFMMSRFTSTHLSRVMEAGLM